jgi:hypothetical protein
MKKLNYDDEVLILFKAIVSILVILGIIVVLIWFIDNMVYKVIGWVLGAISGILGLYLIFNQILLIWTQWKNKAEMNKKEDTIDELEKEIEELKN